MSARPGDTGARMVPARVPSSFFVVSTGGADSATSGALALVQRLRLRGFRMAAMAPVVRDGHWQQGRWHSAHADRLSAAGSFALPPSAVCTYTLPGADEPEAADFKLDSEAVVDSYSVLATWADIVVVDGVNSLCTEVGPGVVMDELVQALKLPVIAVTAAGPEGYARMLATAAFCRDRHLHLAGWLATGAQSESSTELRRIEAESGALCLGAIPAQALNDRRRAATHIDIDRLLAVLMPGGTFH